MPDNTGLLAGEAQLLDDLYALLESQNMVGGVMDISIMVCWGGTQKAVGTEL